MLKKPHNMKNWTKDTALKVLDNVILKIIKINAPI